MLLRVEERRSDSIIGRAEFLLMKYLNLFRPKFNFFSGMSFDFFLRSVHFLS